jgi:predicted choloylglycine hydrolase
MKIVPHGCMRYVVFIPFHHYHEDIVHYPSTLVYQALGALIVDYNSDYNPGRITWESRVWGMTE